MDVLFPNGTVIADVPEGTTKAELLEKLKRNGYDTDALLQTAPTAKEATPESPGFFQSIGKGTESLISSGRTALGTAFGSPEEAARAGIQRGEEISKRYGEGLSLDKLKEVYEKEGLLSAAGEVASAIPGAIGEQLPNLGAMATSARLGAAAGSVFGPYGTAAGALLGMAAPSLVQQFGSNVERQAAEQQARGEAVNIDRARALEAAAPQAALDVVGEAIPLGGRLAGKLFGKEVQSLIFRGERAAADKLAKESLLTTIGKGTATGALAEVPTEVAQQALERWNAGLSLTDDDALKEYADTAFQVSLLAPIGAVGRVSERAAARSELAAGAPETPETPETPEAPTTEEAPPAPKPVEVSPEALAAAKQYSDQIASGQAQFNLFKGRALIRKMGYQIGNDSKFAETKAIFDDLVSGKQVEMPQAGARVAPAAPAEPVDISTLTSGQFVPREEMPRGTATPPVGEAVDTTTGRGAVMPPSGVGAAEPSVAGPQGAGVGPAVGAVETPDVREGAVQPALTEVPAVGAAGGEGKGAAALNGADAFEPKLIEEKRTPEYKGREKLIDMNIDDFLKLAMPGRDEEKYTGTAGILKKGEKFNSLPTLHAYGDGESLKVMGHEGRHRALAMKDAGYETMPVVLTTDIRWSEQNDPKNYDYKKVWPKRIEAQKGTESIPMPVSREQSAAAYGEVKPVEPTKPAEAPKVEAPAFEPVEASAAEAAKKREGPTERQQRIAFGKGVGAAQSYPGDLSGRKNIRAMTAAKKGDFVGVVEALKNSKNKTVAEVAKRAEKLRTKIVIDPEAGETTTWRNRLLDEATIDSAKIHVDALDAMRSFAPEVSKLPNGASLPLDIKYHSIAPELSDGTARNITLRRLNYLFTPLKELTGDNIPFNTKEDFQKALRNIESETERLGEDKLRLTSTASMRGTAIAGKYDAGTDTIHVSDWYARDEHVLAHEIVHAQAVEAVANPTAAQKPVVRRLKDLFIHVKGVLEERGEDDYGITNEQEFLAEGLSNPRFQYKLSRIKYENTTAWDKFVQYIADLLGLKRDNAFTELLTVYGDLTNQESKITPSKVKGTFALPKKTVSKPAKVSAPRPTAQAPSTGPVDNKNRTPEQAIKARQDTYKERFTKKSLSERILKYLWGKDAGGHLLDKYEALVKKFQNDLRPALTLEQALKRAGELITYGPGMNDAFSKIASAQDKAAWLTSNMLKVPMDKAYKAIEKFARSRNLTTDQAIEELDRYRIVLHEPERRMIMFMRYVPLSTKRRAFKDSTGKTIQISPAEIRDSILRSLVKPGNDLVANGQAKQLHNVLKALVSDKANLDPLGDSPIKKEGKPLSIDINDDQYSVLAGYSPEFIAKWKQTFDALGTQKPTAEAAIKAIEDVQEVTKELNRQANYWTKPVDNIVAFYNFEHYTPFKGVPGTKVRASAEMTDPNDVRISGEFADADQAMEGRESEADNSVLQSFSDAMYAASRAGRAGVTEAVKNLIEQGHVSGRKIAEITHEQRWLDKDFNLRQYKGKNKLFHYTPDGNIEVYQIANKDLGFLEAIRRPYQVENWTTKMANNLTGFMGQMHTRFSPSFAPLNFPRDVFTNTMSISADIGGKEALNYLSDALFRNVMKGGLFKSGKVSKLISENRIDELRALAKKDPFYADVIELMEEGGRTAYQQAYNIQAQASELEKRLGPDGIVKMGREGAETLGKWADMYNDAFEFTNRVSAYGIMKSNSMAKLKQRFREKNRREPNAQELAQINKAARSEAASFTKNLANFRLIGTAGRQAGGLFMFFRASATGAVRAIDSLLPAFVDEKTALSKAPASIRDNPESAKRFLKDYRENKKRAQYTMYATAAAGAFLYGLALAGADDDDQGRNKVATDDMARWTRYARLPILGKDTVLQIPWGFGMASFGAIGAQVAALASGNQPAKDAAANIINIATDSFIPLPKSNINVFDNFFGFLVDSATPTLVRPVVEFAMNTDSLGNEIYNSRQSKLSDAFTGGTNVPELYRDVARGLLESTGLSISPNTLYFWMANYADALSRVATSTYDLRLFATGQREFRGVDDLDKVLIPFDSFIGTKSNYDGRQYENVKNQIEDKQKILKSLEQRPEAYVKYVEKHPMDPDLVDYYNKTVNGELKDLQEAANVVRVSDQLTPQQRRDILKENVRMQNMLKRGLIDSFKYYGLKPTN